MGAAKKLPRYFAVSTDFLITFKHGGFKLDALSGAYRGDNLDNDNQHRRTLLFSRRANQL